MRQKLLQLLSNPYLISAFVTIVVVNFLPDYFSKYKAELVNSEFLAQYNVIYYEDLNGDNVSEKIVAQKSQSPGNYNASYLLFNSDDDFIDQFNLDKPFCNKQMSIWFKDLNQDGLKEIYIPTKSNDSIFLSVLEHGAKGSFKHKEVFVDVVAKHQNKFEFRVYSSVPLSIDGQTNNELFFNINNGFAGNPRNLYKYDYSNQTIVKSPHLTNSSVIGVIADLDSDGKDEVLINTNASGNTIDSTYTKKSDYSTWLNVLDDNLNFLFKPKEFEGLGSIQVCYLGKDQDINLIGYFKSREKTKIPSKIISFSYNGVVNKEISFTRNTYRNRLYKINDKSFGIIDFSDSKFTKYDEDLKIIKNHKIKPNFRFYNFDLNSDGKKEWIGFHLIKHTISIFSSDFKNEVIIDINFPLDHSNGFKYGIRKIDDNKIQLYFHVNHSISFFSYEENSFYHLKYLIYLGIYGLVLIILLLVVKGQKNIEAKKHAIEKEISELQLKTIKNQVDPHFVFNAINTISEMTLMDNKLEADKFIGRFSGFMRDTLKQSDKISTTLKEELEYTENFIKLQQIRFNHSFHYEIKIDRVVDNKTIIPKHVLFTYVENALKHGLSFIENGNLKIKATQIEHNLLLTIEDNGKGIQKTLKPKKHSTGSGLKIMDKIFELYTKLYKRKISHHFIELFDEDKNAKGIRVEIKISNKKK